MKLLPTHDGTWIDRQSGIAVTAPSREEAQREIARKIAAKAGEA